MGLEGRGVAADAVQTIDSLIVVEAQRLGAFDIVSTADVRRMMDLEAERSQVGCNDESCLAEIAGAMGASLVVFGDVGTLDGVYSITLNLFDSAAAKALGRTSFQANSAAELPAALNPALRQLVGGYAERAGLVLASPSLSPSAHPGWMVAGLAGGGVAVGLVAMGAGLVPWFQFSTAADVARTTDSRTAFQTASQDMDAAEAAYTSWGQPLAIGGGVFAGVAAAVVVVGVVLAATSESP